MKWIKTCSRSTTPEERFSDLAVDRHIYYSERFEEDKIWKQAFAKAHPRRLFQASLFDKQLHRCCTVLLVLTNSVSNLTIYTSSIKIDVENLHIQTLPSNSPSPIPWSRNVCLELSYLQPPLWKNPPLHLELIISITILSISKHLYRS